MAADAPSSALDKMALRHPILPVDRWPQTLMKADWLYIESPIALNPPSPLLSHISLADNRVTWVWLATQNRFSTTLRGGADKRLSGAYGAIPKEEKKTGNPRFIFVGQLICTFSMEACPMCLTRPSDLSAAVRSELI
jgi:hypothetical protein